MGEVLKATYKYNPAKFEGLVNLPEDLMDFYKAHARFKKEKSDAALLEMRMIGRQTLFTIKHRKDEGVLEEREALEIEEYVEELMYGSL